MPLPLVGARLKYYPRHGYARILCGRPTSLDQFCTGDLGRVYALPLIETDTEDLDDSRSYDLVSAGGGGKRPNKR